MPRASASSNPRIGLREIAAASGVGLMTASLSLRNSPKISADTRERVRTAAARLGYRPDPEISRLMGRLRPARTIRGGVVIAVIDFHPDSGASDQPYDRDLRHGIVARAEALGFGVTRFRLTDYGGDLKQMLRVIRSRGITGVLLAPAGELTTLPPDADWTGLSVVAATTSVISPRFHRVVPNQLYNMMTLIEVMRKRGFVRIGAVFGGNFEARTGHHYSAALAWFGHRERLLILPHALPAAASDRLVREWLHTHRPDVILAQHPALVAHLLSSAQTGRAGSTPALVSLDTSARGQLPYQDERPEAIGQSAVNLLVGMMHNNETGVPAHPHTTTIDGVFREDPAQRLAAVRRIRAAVT